MKLLKDMEAKCLEIIIQQLLRGLLCIFHYGSQEIILLVQNFLKITVTQGLFHELLKDNVQ